MTSNRNTPETPQEEAPCHPWADALENFQVFFNLCPDFLFVLDMEGNIIQTNDTVLKVLGYSNGELMGMPVVLLHPEHRREEAGIIVKEMLEGRRENCPVPLLTRDGREIPVETRIILGRWNGQPCLFGYSRNMMELKESEERLQLVLSGADLGTWDWDIPTGEVHFNQRWTEMLGYDMGEIEPHVRTWETLLHPEDAGPVTEVLQRHLDGEIDAYQTEHRLRSKSGAWVWVLDSGRVTYRDGSGVPLRMAGIHMNISARKQAEEEILEHRDNLEKLVRDRTRQLKEAQKGLLVRAVEAGRLQAMDMMLHNIGNAVTPILLQIDKLVMMSTENQALKYLDACYRELLAHQGDLDRYLSGDTRGKEIFSYMGKLLDALLLEHREEQTDGIRAIQSAARHISEILKVQSFSMNNCGIKEPLSVAEIIKKALLIQEPALNKRNIRLRTSLDPQVVITADRNAMSQVVMNLIKNAYEALDPPGHDVSKKEIAIHAFRENKRAFLEISDSGIGLAPEELNMAFETGVSGKGSSGFGLFYCKTIVEANGGTISLKSAGKGRGATVRMSFKEGEDGGGTGDPVAGTA